MAQDPLIPLEDVGLLPLIAERLNEVVDKLHWSKSRIVNDSLIHTLGLDGLVLSDDQMWGFEKEEEKDEKEKSKTDA